MACDICNRRGTQLTNLRECFATKDIHAICPDCERAVNQHLSKLDSMWVRMRTALLNRFMSERAAQKQGAGHAS